METGKFYSCLVLTNRLSRRILRFRTSAIDLTHSERVLTSTSSFLAHRLTYSSHASMMILKFWYHENEVPCISGPCAKHLSVFGYGRYWDHLSLYGHMERIEIQNHSRNKVWDSEKDHRSLFAADLLCSWKIWKQPNGYSYKKWNKWIKLQKLGLITCSCSWNDRETAFKGTCLNWKKLKTSMVISENVMEMGAVFRAQHPLHKNVSYFISEFTDWNENSHMHCLMVLNITNKNDSILLEVLALVFKVSAYFFGQPTYIAEIIDVKTQAKTTSRQCNQITWWYQ